MKTQKDRIRRCIYISGAVWKAAKAAAKEQNASASKYIETLVENDQRRSRVSHLKAAGCR